MSKYILIALLSLQVSADETVTDDAAAGICAVMINQIKPENVTSGVVAYWQAKSKLAKITLSQYHKACLVMVDKYNRDRSKGLKSNDQGKL